MRQISNLQSKICNEPPSLLRDGFLVHFYRRATASAQANHEELVLVLHRHVSISEQYALLAGIIDRVITHAHGKIIVPDGLARLDEERLAAALHVVDQAHSLNDDGGFQVIAETNSGT